MPHTSSSLTSLQQRFSKRWSDQSLDLYALGNALVDYEYKVSDELLRELNIAKGLMHLIDDQQLNHLLKKLGQCVKRQSGGSAANTAVSFAQLGGKAAYACKVSQDHDGEFYLADLLTQGVAHHHQFQTGAAAQAATGKSFILVSPDAERTMNTYLGTTAQFSKDNVDPARLLQAKIIYIEGYLLCTDQGTEAALQAQQLGKKHGLCVALTFSDAGVIQAFYPRFKQLIDNGIDLLFSNEQEGLSFTQTKDYKAALKILGQHCAHVVMTRSDQGFVTLETSGAEQAFPAVPTKAIDVVGAGDSFAGAYMRGLLAGLPLAQTAQLATEAAAIVVSQFGPRVPKEVMLQLSKKYLS